MDLSDLKYLYENLFSSDSCDDCEVAKHQTVAGDPTDPKDAPGDPKGFKRAKGKHKEVGGYKGLVTQKPHGSRGGVGSGSKQTVMTLLRRAAQLYGAKVSSWNRLNRMSDDKVWDIAAKIFGGEDRVAEMIISLPEKPGGEHIDVNDIPEELISQYYTGPRKTPKASESNGGARTHRRFKPKEIAARRFGRKTQNQRPVNRTSRISGNESENMDLGNNTAWDAIVAGFYTRAYWAEDIDFSDERAGWLDLALADDEFNLIDFSIPDEFPNPMGEKVVITIRNDKNEVIGYRAGYLANADGFSTEGLEFTTLGLKEGSGERIFTGERVFILPKYRKTGAYDLLNDATGEFAQGREAEVWSMGGGKRIQAALARRSKEEGPGGSAEGMTLATSLPINSQPPRANLTTEDTSTENSQKEFEFSIPKSAVDTIAQIAQDSADNGADRGYSSELIESFEVLANLLYSESYKGGKVTGSRELLEELSYYIDEHIADWNPDNKRSLKTAIKSINEALTGVKIEPKKQPQVDVAPAKEPKTPNQRIPSEEERAKIRERDIAERGSFLRVLPGGREDDVEAGSTTAQAERPLTADLLSSLREQRRKKEEANNRAVSNLDENIKSLKDQVIRALNSMITSAEVSGDGSAESYRKDVDDLENLISLVSSPTRGRFLNRPLDVSKDFVAKTNSDLQKLVSAIENADWDNPNSAKPVPAEDVPKVLARAALYEIAARIDRINDKIASKSLQPNDVDVARQIESVSTINRFLDSKYEGLRTGPDPETGERRARWLANELIPQESETGRELQEYNIFAVPDPDLFETGASGTAFSRNILPPWKSIQELENVLSTLMRFSSTPTLTQLKKVYKEQHGQDLPDYINVSKKEAGDEAVYFKRTITFYPAFFRKNNSGKRATLYHEVAHALESLMVTDDAFFDDMYAPNFGKHYNNATGEDTLISYIDIPGEHVADTYATILLGGDALDSLLAMFPDAVKITYRGAIKYGFPLPAESAKKIVQYFKNNPNAKNAEYYDPRLALVPELNDPNDQEKLISLFLELFPIHDVISGQERWMGSQISRNQRQVIDQVMQLSGFKNEKSRLVDKIKQLTGLSDKNLEKILGKPRQTSSYWGSTKIPHSLMRISPEVPLLSSIQLKKRPWGYAAVLDGRTVGSLEVGRADENGIRTIEDILVEEEHRRKGIATALFNFAEKDGELKHSENLSEEGKAWVDALKRKNSSKNKLRERQKLYQQILDEAQGTNLEGLPKAAVAVGKIGKLRFGANKFIQGLANRFNRGNNLGEHPTNYLPVNPEIASRIAEEYDKLEHDPNNPEVKAAYNALKRELMQQYKAILDAGYSFDFYPDGRDPYPDSPRQAILDLIENKRMYVYPTIGKDGGFGEGADEYPGHPLLEIIPALKWGDKAVTYNDVFRAVHDFFGHAKEGLGFRADGEDNAYRQHHAMFSPEAQRALATETRGQNSWVNFGPAGEHNRTATSDTIYADQKAGLLPEWVIDPDLHTRNIDEIPMAEMGMDEIKRNLDIIEDIFSAWAERLGLNAGSVDIAPDDIEDYKKTLNTVLRELNNIINQLPVPEEVKDSLRQTNYLTSTFPGFDPFNFDDLYLGSDFIYQKLRIRIRGVKTIKDTVRNSENIDEFLDVSPKDFLSRLPSFVTGDYQKISEVYEELKNIDAGVAEPEKFKVLKEYKKLLDKVENGVREFLNEYLRDNLEMILTSDLSMEERALNFGQRSNDELSAVMDFLRPTKDTLKEVSRLSNDVLAEFRNRGIETGAGRNIPKPNLRVIPGGRQGETTTQEETSVPPPSRVIDVLAERREQKLREKNKKPKADKELVGLLASGASAEKVLDKLSGSLNRNLENRLKDFIKDQGTLAGLLSPNNAEKLGQLTTYLDIPYKTIEEFQGMIKEALAELRREFDRLNRKESKTFEDTESLREIISTMDKAETNLAVFDTELRRQRINKKVKDNELQPYDQDVVDEIERMVYVATAIEEAKDYLEPPKLDESKKLLELSLPKSFSETTQKIANIVYVANKTAKQGRKDEYIHNKLKNYSETEIYEAQKEIEKFYESLSDKQKYASGRLGRELYNIIMSLENEIYDVYTDDDFQLENDLSAMKVINNPNILGRVALNIERPSEPFKNSAIKTGSRSRYDLTHRYLQIVAGPSIDYRIQANAPWRDFNYILPILEKLSKFEGKLPTLEELKAQGFKDVSQGVNKEGYTRLIIDGWLRIQYDPNETATASVSHDRTSMNLYSGWFNKNKNGKAYTFFHEIGHSLDASMMLTPKYQDLVNKYNFGVMHNPIDGRIEALGYNSTVSEAIADGYAVLASNDEKSIMEFLKRFPETAKGIVDAAKEFGFPLSSNAIKLVNNYIKDNPNVKNKELIDTRLENMPIAIDPNDQDEVTELFLTTLNFINRYGLLLRGKRREPSLANVVQELLAVLTEPTMTREEEENIANNIISNITKIAALTGLSYGDIQTRVGSRTERGSHHGVIVHPPINYSGEPARVAQEAEDYVKTTGQGDLFEGYTGPSTSVEENNFTELSTNFRSGSVITLDELETLSSVSGIDVNDDRTLMLVGDDELYSLTDDRNDNFAIKNIEDLTEIDFPEDVDVRTFTGPNGETLVIEDMDVDNVKTIDAWLADRSFYNDSHKYVGFITPLTKEFWEAPEPLYHATDLDNLESILENGLEARNNTRAFGRLNDSIGDAVFTSREYANDTYGSLHIEIDTDAMKRDGFMPELSYDGQIENALGLQNVASILGADNFNAFEELSGTGLDENTVVIYGNIPAKYLKIDQDLVDQVTRVFDDLNQKTAEQLKDELEALITNDVTVNSLESLTDAQKDIIDKLPPTERINAIRLLNTGQTFADIMSQAVEVDVLNDLDQLDKTELLNTVKSYPRGEIRRDSSIIGDSRDALVEAADNVNEFIAQNIPDDIDIPLELFVGESIKQQDAVEALERILDTIKRNSMTIDPVSSLRKVRSLLKVLTNEAGYLYKIDRNKYAELLSKYGVDKTTSDKLADLNDSFFESLVGVEEAVYKALDKDGTLEKRAGIMRAIEESAFRAPRINFSNRSRYTDDDSRRSRAFDGMASAEAVDDGRDRTINGGAHGDWSVYENPETNTVFLQKDQEHGQGLSELIGVRLAEKLGIGHVVPAVRIDSADNSPINIELLEGGNFHDLNVSNTYTTVVISMYKYYRYKGLTQEEAARTALADAQRMSIFDTIFGVADRSRGNSIINPETGKVDMIDFGFIFAALKNSTKNRGLNDPNSIKKFLDERSEFIDAGVQSGYAGFNYSDLLPEVVEWLQNLDGAEIVQFIRSILTSTDSPIANDVLTGRALDSYQDYQVGYTSWVMPYLSTAIDLMVKELLSRNEGKR